VTCQHCGAPIPAGSRRDRRYCSNNCNALASYYRRKAGIAPPPRWRHPALESDNLLLRTAAEHARQLGQAHGWSPSTIRCTIDGLTALLDDLPAGCRVRSSQVRARIPRKTPILRVTEVLGDLDLLDDDTIPTIRSWIDRNTEQLPPGFAEPVRAWLLTLLDGDRRARPRSPNSLYVYFSFVRPAIEQWAVDRGHLREITRTDVTAVLKPLRGHRHGNTVAALRSLFRFAKKRGLVFANPTTRLKATGVEPALIPLTDTEIHAIEVAATNPAQRLIVALAVVHAARAATIRQLTLDDLDLPNRRITLAGHPQRLGELALGALQTWLEHRKTVWPHSPNRHVLISARTAIATTPVSNVYLQNQIRRLGVTTDRLRQDRILHEAVTAGADPLHLSLVFNLSLTTAGRYAEIAVRLLDDQPGTHHIADTWCLIRYASSPVRGTPPASVPILAPLGCSAAYRDTGPGGKPGAIPPQCERV
jgi:integrase